MLEPESTSVLILLVIVTLPVAPAVTDCRDSPPSMISPPYVPDCGVSCAVPVGCAFGFTPTPTLAADGAANFELVPLLEEYLH